MRIAITGATGFLGSHLTRRLARDGHTLRLLAHDVTKADGLVRELGERVEACVQGEITDATALAESMDGCELALHLVSNFRTSKGSRESYFRINVRGTEEALAAARRAGVRRFVHCSTIGVHGDVQSTPGHEDAPFNPGDLYQETKLEAEKACRRAMEEPGMDIVIVRPCSMYGPGDLRMLKMFRMLSKGTFFLLGPCRENFHAVYVDDLVEGWTKVIHAPDIAGETFILGGPRYLPLDDYVKVAAAAVGAPPPRLRFPYGPAFAISVLCEAVCVPLRIEPPLHPRRVRFFKNNRAFSIDKARRVLGYDPQIDLREGMSRTVAWYRSQGLL
ncbi:MAG: NAD-dependent epimerase/dehydratase family protein [Candidatus Eisenbacteria bacterium]|uniref:NAD-dependent epimerase/dehydratase family protein n=1 Tax=Eiseniibacteriota bacterium TaxID=2212470 RepID=A0A956LXH7_UNCEI|nr:NAD-dependent epimerase/dehydratase family protein [Candidatus Eisenbacteria bacterium]